MRYSRTIPNVRTMKWIIKWFQMEYMLVSTPRLGRPHTLSDDDRTNIVEHTNKHPSMSCAVLLTYSATRAKPSIQRIFHLANFHVVWTETGRLHSTLQSLRLFFKKFGCDFETMAIIFFKTKHGFICWDMLIRKIIVSSWQIIRTFSKKLRYTQLKSVYGAQFPFDQIWEHRRWLLIFWLLMGEGVITEKKIDNLRNFLEMRMFMKFWNSIKILLWYVHSFQFRNIIIINKE